MLTRFVLPLAVVAVSAAGLCAADLPAGTWPANVDGEKGDLVVTLVKDGKVTGSLLGTDFTGTWDGKTLAFAKGRDVYEAHLLGESAEKGKTKYTLTGTRSRPLTVPNRATGVVHYEKTGWYAQLTADTPAPTGFIRAEVRGTLVCGKSGAYVLVKHLVGATPTETRVQLVPADWAKAKESLVPLDGKDVIVTGALAELPRDRANPFGGLAVVGAFEIKPAAESK